MLLSDLVCLFFPFVACLFPLLLSYLIIDICYVFTDRVGSLDHRSPLCAGRRGVGVHCPSGRAPEKNGGTSR